MKQISSNFAFYWYFLSILFNKNNFYPKSSADIKYSGYNIILRVFAVSSKKLCWHKRSKSKAYDTSQKIPN